MGFIYGIKHTYSRISAENPFPYILAWAAVCTYNFSFPCKVVTWAAHEIRLSFSRNDLCLNIQRESLQTLWEGKTQ